MSGLRGAAGLVLAAGVWLLVSCAAESPPGTTADGGEHISGDGRLAFEVPIPGGSELKTSVELDFGPASLGGADQRRIFLVNTGTETVHVPAVRRDADFDSTFLYAFSPFDVAPDGRAEFVVRFQPHVAGLHTGTFRFEVHHGEPAELTLTLKGTGIEIECAVEPADSVDFGSTPVTRTVTVRNASALAFGVDLAEIDSGGDTGAFRFGAGFGPGWYTVRAAAGGVPGTLEIPLELEPSRAGAHAGSLSFSSFCQPAVVSLKGRGI